MCYFGSFKAYFEQFLVVSARSFFNKNSEECSDLFYSHKGISLAGVSCFLFVCFAWVFVLFFWGVGRGFFWLVKIFVVFVFFKQFVFHFRSNHAPRVLLTLQFPSKKPQFTELLQHITLTDSPQMKNKTFS